MDLVHIREGSHQGDDTPVERYRELERELRRRVMGDVRFDAGTRAVFAVDASNYRQVPIGAVIPRSVQDVVETVAVCREFAVPVLSRGGGTSLAGQCCNVAMVMDWSRHLDNILEINAAEKWARVQPGCILDSLRNAARRHGLTFGPDPATHSHCTLGGMIGNNSCGVHAQMAGKTVDNVESLEVLTYDGTRLTAGWMTDADLEHAIAAGGRCGQIMDAVRKLREQYAALVRSRYPKIPRRVSGYNLDELLPDKDGRFNLARALVGAEGTLVTILEAKVKLVHWPPWQALLLLGYRDICAAADAVPEILLQSKPIGFEAFDALLVENSKKKGLHLEYLKKLPQGKAWLLLQFGGETRADADEQAQALRAQLKLPGEQVKLYSDQKDERQVWKVRESALGASSFVPGEPLVWEGWEDSAVAPKKLGVYLRDLCKLYEKYGYIGAFYGHFGQGCVHTRISFDLMSASGVRKFRSFIEEAADLVVSHGGSLSGEHGDGQARSELLVKMFGPELVAAFREFKAIWDPDGMMNPGKVVDPYRLDENLRLGADYKPWAPETHFQFPDDHGSLAHAALRCVGVGKCRRQESDDAEDDTMCPSYMVTREEKHSTRGRIHLLWEMLHGYGEGGRGPIRDGWRDERVKEALDLCLACKGCKSECPVSVDMATYKAEFLSHYWEGRLRPRQAYAFGLIDQWARAASIWPGLVNLITSTPGLRDLAKKAAGIPAERQIPQFAPQTFQAWWKRRQNGHSGATQRRRGRVLLWPDTFNNYFFPETARAAVEVLEAAGYEVEVPGQHICCGRPLYDYGMLDLAKQYLLRMMQQLEPQIQAGIPMVVLEPSCASVLRDEIRQLFPGDERAQKIVQQTFLLSEFLEKKTEGYVPPRLKRKAVVQGHCHHKAIMKFQDEKSLLQQMELEADILPSGCCGMAGSFGFEEATYEVSVQCGERVLLPKVRQAEADTIIVADGFSCREQIAQLSSRHALHLAEVMRMALNEGDANMPGRPEDALVRERERAIRTSKLQTGAVLAGLAAVCGALWWALRRR